MKILKNKMTRKVMQRALRAWAKKGKPIPSDGYMVSVYYKDCEDGNHYWVDVITDCRFQKSPELHLYRINGTDRYKTNVAQYTLVRKILLPSKITREI